MPPYAVPVNDACFTKSDGLTGMWSRPLVDAPTCTAAPPGARTSIASGYISGRMVSAVNRTRSTPRPRVMRAISARGSCSDARMKSVAPSASATSRLASRMSIPMMLPAPPSTAPRIAAAPTPPTPITATESPGWVRATLRTAPTPVDTPHEIRAAVSGSRSFGTTAQFTAGLTVCALKLPRPRVVAMSVPSAPCMRNVLSANEPSGCAYVVQNVFLPRRQLSHRPHGPTNRWTTWSPTSMPSTPGPTASTMPAPSWPHTAGPRWGSGRGARGGRSRRARRPSSGSAPPRFSARRARSSRSKGAG